ncbi:MAG: NAD(P)H-hydrate epimerase [Actinobacteria bacterium]|nr:NAD(P)H-hydrate epimerase [Actinomycetota bacterium]
MTSASRSPEGSGFPSATASSIPAVTEEQMRDVDRLAVEEFDLLLIQMMENAGAHLADLALRRFQPEAVAVLCGAGGNGGGGLVAARHLANRGVRVAVTLDADPDRLGDVPVHQLAMLRRMGVPIGTEPIAAELVLDAVIGYSLRGDPRGRAAELIGWAKEQQAPVCSLDVPSGLDATTGDIRDPCVRATATLTLALPKTGLAAAPDVVGELYLGDISIPRALYAKLGIEVGPVFASGPILRLA